MWMRIILFKYMKSFKKIIHLLEFLVLWLTVKLFLKMHPKNLITAIVCFNP